PRPAQTHHPHDLADAVVPRNARRRRSLRSGGLSAFAERTLIMGSRRMEPMPRIPAFALSILSVLSFLAITVAAQVAPDRLQNAAREPQNWLIYSGGYASNRHSALTQITPANARNLELAWMYQAAAAGAWQSRPLVVDGVMYLTQRPNDVVALDAKTGRVFWIYRYPPPESSIVCCGANNRGLAILGDALYMGTLDAHLVAIDAKN